MMDISSDYIGEKKSKKDKKETGEAPRDIPQAKIITNIMSITELKSSKYNKHIYIFGEVHNANFNCGKNSSFAGKFISDQLKFLDVNSSKTIDLFIEVPKITSNSPIQIFGYPGSPNIQFIYKQFKSCFNPDKKDCETKNIRFHYSDIRSNWGDLDIKNTDVVMEKINEVFCDDSISQEELEDKWYDEKYLLNKHHPKEFREYKNCKNETDFIIRGMKMFDGSKLFKNMSKIAYREVKFVLQERIKSLVSKYYKFLSFEKIDKFASDAETYSFLIYTIQRNIMCNTLLNYESVYMDAYLISRMFRTFNLKLGESKEREEPKNAIILVGNNHADSYVEILKKLGFDIVFRNSNVNGDCLDISKLQQPLFMSKSEIENYSKTKSKDDYGDSMEEGMF